MEDTKNSYRLWQYTEDNDVRKTPESTESKPRLIKEWRVSFRMQFDLIEGRISSDRKPIRGS